MSIAYLSIANSIPIPWLHTLIVCIQFIFPKYLDIFHVHPVNNLFLWFCKFVARCALPQYVIELHHCYEEWQWQVCLIGFSPLLQFVLLLFIIVIIIWIFKVLTSSLLLKSEWLKFSSEIQDSPQYSSRSQQCCCSYGLDSPSDFQFLYSLFEGFENYSKFTNYN